MHDGTCFVSTYFGNLVLLIDFNNASTDMAHFMVYLSLWSALVLASNSASVPCAKNVPRGFGSAKHAIIIGIDGLGGVFLKNATQNISTLHSFMERGAYTTQARGAYPTFSAPNWSVYLTGMEPMQTGIFSNSWTIDNSDPANLISYSVPPLSGRGLPTTIFRQVHEKDSNLKTAMIFAWEWLKYFAVNNTDVDEWFWGGQGLNRTENETFTEFIRRQDRKVMNRTLKYIKENKPTLTFVHLDVLDAAGHTTGWGGPKYYEVLSEIDGEIKKILDILNETKGTSGKPMLDDTLVMIVSDHGGWNMTHKYGAPFIALVDIPILISGPGVIKNKSLNEEAVSSLDVAVTVLNALGIEKTQFMRGRVLENIYPSSPLPVSPNSASGVLISSFCCILMLISAFMVTSGF